MITFGDVRKRKHILKEYGISIDDLNKTANSLENKEKYLNTLLWACDVIEEERHGQSITR